MKPPAPGPVSSDSQTQDRGYRRVDGIAAFAQDARAGFRRQRVTRSDDSVGGMLHHKLAGPRAGLRACRFYAVGSSGRRVSAITW
jgi:hypothetical protein